MIINADNIPNYFQMQHLNIHSNNNWRFSNNVQTWQPSQRESNALPEHIIPHKPTSRLLNKMAHRANERYDKVSQDAQSTIKPPPNFNHNTENPPENPEVLFLPGSTPIDCNEKVATSGKSQNAFPSFHYVPSKIRL